MQDVYFDRNVFADICEPHRRDISPDAVNKIRCARTDGRIRILSSYILFDETIKTMLRSGHEYDRQVKTLLSLIDQGRVIKHHDKLLMDDLTSYAFRCPAYVRTEEMPLGFKRVLDPKKNHDDLIDLSGKIKDFYETAGQNITEGLRSARLEMEKLSSGENIVQGEVENFEELLYNSAREVIKSYLERHPDNNVRERCHARGIEGLLKVKSFRLYSLYYIWIIHADMLAKQGVRKMTANDWGDFMHAVSSSAAHIFVTQEKHAPNKLPGILTALPVNKYEVLSLAQFIERL